MSGAPPAGPGRAAEPGSASGTGGRAPALGDFGSGLDGLAPGWSRGVGGRGRAPADVLEAVPECLPDVAEAGAGGQVAADGVGRANLVAECLDHGAAEADHHLVVGLDRGTVLGDADQHLAPARFLRRLVAGAGDVGAAQRLPRLLEIDAESRP